MVAAPSATTTGHPEFTALNVERGTATPEPIEYHDFAQWNPDIPKELLGHGLLHPTQKLILYGPRKVFKSMLVQYLCQCWRYGVDFLDIPVPAEGVSVLYLQLELSHELFHQRLTRMHDHFAGRHQDPKPLWLWTERMIKLDGGPGVARLSKYLDLYRPQVLILDPLYKLLSASINDQLAMTQLFDQLDVLADKYNCAIMLVAHPRKPQPGSTPDRFSSDDLMGQSLFAAWADTVIQLTRQKGADDNDVRVLTFEATRYAREELDPIEIRFDRNNMQFDLKPRTLTI